METVFDELKRYVRFGAQDAELVARVRPFAAPHLERIAREFYERIREHEDAHIIFSDEDQIQRLHRSLARWMDRLLSGTYDEAYFRETQRIGSTHVRVGLPQRYMFAAMALIRGSLERIVDEHLGADAARTRDALHRLIDIELAVMVEGYREHLEQRIQANSRLERQELNRTLVRTEHRYVSAVELARVMVIGLDAAASVRLFNREAERVTGYGRDEVFGKNIADLLADDVREAHAARVRSVASGAKSAATEMLESVVRARNGRLRDVRWQLAYAPAAGDVADEVVLFVIGPDITDERVAAARAHRHEKLAAVGTLAAGLAHEIRNPLNGAQLHLSYLERALKKMHDGRAQQEMLEAVGVVGDEIKRLARLVTEFLDFARPKSLEIKTTSLHTICRRAAHLAGAQADPTQISVATDLPQNDVVFDADPAKLEQVLLNVAQNAVEALTPGGGGRVVIRGRRRPREVVVEIEDDGPGLSSPDAPIFDAFFSTKPGGTGLGLAITHRIVSDHHGAIDVESRPGRTIFRITLPLEQPKKEEARS
jgi:PAS domain S-box-containing protein